MRVLVTGAGALLGQGIIRALRSSNLGATIIAADPSPLAAALYWADEAYIVPPASDPSYLDAVEDLLGRTGANALLVGTDVELPALSAARDRFEAGLGVQVVVSPPAAIGVADDKWKTASFLRAHGFEAPDSALASDAAALAARVGFPLIVKPRVGARSVGLSIVRDPAELGSALAGDKGDLVVQELVGSDRQEFTASILCFDGQAQASIVVRRDLRDGNTYRARVEPFAEFHGELRRMAEALAIHGPLNVQFRLRDGRPVPFELNARFSGTTPLRALAGFNEVEMTLRRLLLGEEVVQPRVRSMTILRHWSETIVDEERHAELARG